MSALTREEEQAVRAAWASVGSWEQTTEAEEQWCPTCDGEGYVEGVRYDATAVCPATVVGYGIGDGLAAAELLVTSTGGLLATLDAERAKSAELLAALVYLVEFCAAGGSPDDDDLKPARAVIARATGGEP